MAKVTSWDGDLCVCGCVRTAHRRGPRPPWPATQGKRGRCTTCRDCKTWAIDVEALLAREAAERVGRVEAVREMIANPRFGYGPFPRP